MNLTESVIQVIPATAVLVVLLVVVQVLATRFNWMGSIASEGQNRLPALDGLRAYLAFGVVVCHVGTYYYIYQGKPWGVHPNPYYRQGGAASVRLFFMITGYLFWNKAIIASGAVNAGKLYLNRIRRIMPLYVVFCLAIAVLAFVASQGRFLESPVQVLKEFLILLIPGYRPAGELNGFDFSLISKQAWTLLFEFIFYALIPLIAVAAKSFPRFIGLAVLSLVATIVIRRKLGVNVDISIVANFLVGMFAAHLLTIRPNIEFFRSKGASAIILAIALGAPILMDRFSMELGNLLYAVVFILILYGNDIFGLLTLRASRILGDVSYSTYLLHLLVIYVYLQGADKLVSIDKLSHLAFWAVLAPSFIFIYVASVLGFKYVERPWISKKPTKASIPVST